MLLIKNVKVIDGSGKPAYPADVLVIGNKISAIGNFPNKKADQIIEGLGGYLTPGFIDTHTDADHQLTLFTNPSQKNFLMQGVTTIIGGHCGSSLAPLIYGSLESIQKWADIDQINVNWHSFEEFLENIKKLSLGVNFGSLIGHSTIRRALIGEDLRDLTEKELKVFQHLIRESLEAGALGFSTGLGYSHSRQTPYKEIKSLISILPKYNAAYTTHLRDEKENLYDAVNESLNLFKETGVKTVISHFRPLLGFVKNFDAAFDLIEKSSNKMSFHFDIYPFDTSITPIYTLLPIWAQRGGKEAMLAMIQDSATVARINKELPKSKKSELTIAWAPGNDFLVGKSVDSKNLIDIMKATKLKAMLSHKNIDYKRVQQVIFSDKALIASNSGGLGERSTGTFPKFIELATKKKGYSLEQAIQKITSLPTLKFNIKNRGLIQDGYFADLTLILNNKIQDVIVNGEIAVRKGEYKNTRSGQIIRA